MAKHARCRHSISWNAPLQVERAISAFAGRPLDVRAGTKDLPAFLYDEKHLDTRTGLTRAKTKSGNDSLSAKAGLQPVPQWQLPGCRVAV